MLDTSISRAQQWIAVIGLALAAAFLGALVPIYAGLMGESPARLMALPAVVVLGLLLVLSPEFLLVFALLFRAASDHVFESSRVSIFGYATGLGGLLNAFIILVVLVLVVQRPALFPRKFALAWVPFLATAAYGVLIAPTRGDAVRMYLTFLTYFAVFVAAFYVVRSEKDWRNAIRLVLLSSAIPAAYALVDIALRLRATGLGGFRLESTFTHPNIFAFYLTLTLILYVTKSAVFTVSPAKRLWLAAYAFYLLGLLVLTQTRSAWIVCATVFAIYGLFFQRRYLAYLTVGCALALLLPPVQERLVDLTEGNEYVQYARLNSFAWRRILWESALGWMEPGRYAFGYGANSFPLHAQVFFPFVGRAMPAAHNVYVQWLFEFGMVGLLALLWLFYKILRTAKDLLPVEPLAAFVAAVLVLGYLISSISDNMMAYLAFNWYFWFIVGAACALVRLRPPAST